MHTERNIIDFSGRRRAAQSPSTVNLPQLVISAQRRSKHYLKVLLPTFFSQADDSLFELAKKADNNQEQTLYFEVMRELRLQQDAMQKHCIRVCEQRFLASLIPQDTTLHANQSLNDATLVDNEQLEISLAINTMSNNAENLYREELYAFTARFDFLIDDMHITNRNNPLRPLILCEAFVECMENIDTDFNVKLIIYKLFDKFVMQKLGTMYQAINADLIAAGVLPRIKSTIVKSDSDEIHITLPETDTIIPPNTSHPSPSPTEKTAAGHQEQNTELFYTLQALLQSQRMESVEKGSEHIDAYAKNHGQTSPGSQHPSFQSREILNALSTLQNRGDTPLPDGQLPSSATILKSIIEDILSHQDDDTREIDQTDMDTIDIVGMLFDFILDDPGLSNHIKAQLGRLQIPLLKVAILDKSFFSQKTHPARQLLNELAYAGNSLDDNDIQTDAIYTKISNVVERILTEYDQENNVFVELLSEFSEFIASEREANRRAEVTLIEARTRVAKEIQRRITRNPVAPLVNHILTTAWKEVLIHLYRRDGDQSIGWNTALQVADDLLWSIQPKLVINERQRLIKIIPRILNGLRDGLTLIRYDQDATEQIFSGLESLHLTSLRGGPSEHETQPVQTTPKSHHNGPKQWLSEEDFGIDMTCLPEESENIPDSAAGDNLMEEIILASSQPWNQTSEFNHVGTELREMALGTWVEFSDPDSECHRRGKLSWKCDFTNEYTFVDRKFKVVADLTLVKLAEEFELGRARIVEDMPLFDRALDSVIGGIKQALDVVH